MATVLDTTRDCSSIAALLRQQGYDTVIRYYTRSAWKRLGQAEAVALSRAGLRIAVVYQNRQNCAEDFSEAKGQAAGAHAVDYAENVIFQPHGSAIFFSVDYDATADDVSRGIAPFFVGVRKAFEAAGGGTPPYRVGVYGSGRTCRLLKAAGLVDLTWLAQASGWSEFERHDSSRQWHLKQNMPSKVCGIDCDTNEINPDLADFGAFTLDVDGLGPAVPPVEPPPAAAARFTVIARDGLRLRAGPSTGFEVRSVLPFGTSVAVIGRNGDWSLVDLNGDGAADGFCHSAFLQAV